MIRRQSLRIIVLIVLFAAVTNLLIPVASVSHAQCEPPECYPPDPPIAQPPDDWTGTTDDRLNPVMDEYYSLWCKNDNLEVWGGKPNPEMVSLIPIIEIMNLGDGGILDGGNGVAVTRNGDTVIVSGNNGNDEPNAGTKAFSLSECTARNGGTPPPPAQEGEAPEEPTVGETTSNYPSYGWTDVMICLGSMGPFGMVASVPALRWWRRRRKQD